MELMPQGLEVYRADGSLLLGIDDRVVRVVTVGNAGSGGNYTDLNNLVNVTAAMMVASTGNDTAADRGVPQVSHGNGIVNWSWTVSPDRQDPNAGYTILVL